MLKMLTQFPNASIRRIKSLIDNGTIRTWSHNSLTNGNTRLDWIGGRNNWPNLDVRVYFEIVVNNEDEENNFLLFKLHTRRNHQLNEAEYAQMHSELLGMLFTHLSSNIRVCGVQNAVDKNHKVDVID